MQAQLDFLRAAQNPDGGWGFFPGKQSWLEPTAYALLGLAGAPEFEQAFDRGWRLMTSWQLPDGSWPACAAVREPHWTTSLCVTLHCARGAYDDRFRRGVEWLTGLSGIENGLKFRLAHFLRPNLVELDPSFKGWPWRPDNASWIEPTAHALVALKAASRHGGDSRLRERIDSGERMLLERRCSDGGWNYGNRRVLGVDLLSYPETTALALVGLTGRTDVPGPLKLARRHWDDTKSPLAKAWLRIALTNNGDSLPADAEQQLSSNDVILNALALIAAKKVFA
jgi:hypothetical protein